MRTQIGRLARLTNAFRRKLENHKAAVALRFAYCSFCQSRGAFRGTPAMEAGIADGVWSMARNPEGKRRPLRTATLMNELTSALLEEISCWPSSADAFDLSNWNLQSAK